jgi:ArsR family transcriptional regulator
MDKLNALTAFSALSQETRLDVVRLLIEAGEAGLQAGEIGDRLGVKQNTMSANLSILAQSGLVRSVREGRSIRYFADMAGIGGVIDFLLRDCCGGKPELCQPILDKAACGC